MWPSSCCRNNVAYCLYLAKEENRRDFQLWCMSMVGCVLAALIGCLSIGITKLQLGKS